MISYADMIAALTADYLNVYVAEPEKDSGTVVKLLGYVIEGIKEQSENFRYSEMLRSYAEKRVYEEDQAAFLKELLPEGLLRNFADGREKLELHYRVPIGERLEHFAGLYTRISKAGAPLKLVVGFRNIESVISIQKKNRNEGLYSAYAAISDVYLSMHRVNVKTNTYSVIKTTEGILRYTLPDSDRFDENIRSIIKGLATEESYATAMEFLDIRTLKERMREKNHLTTRFIGKIVGNCRLHLIKEDTDSEGNPWHVIFAVEVSEEDTYQSVFQVFSRNFKNIYLVNPCKGTARILKFEDEYGDNRLDDVKDQVFPYEGFLHAWIKETVHPDDQAMLREVFSPKHLCEILAKQEEYTGNYRMLVDGKAVNYQFMLSKLSEDGQLVVGFQNVEKIIREHLEQERKEQEKEEAYQRELRKHAEVISSLSTIYSTIFRADLETHEYEVLNSVTRMSEVAKWSGNFDEVKEKILEVFMAEDSREKMWTFLDLDTMAERLQKTNTIVTEYKSPEGKWLQGRLIVKGRDESGRAKEVLYVARDFTEEKEKDLTQREQLSLALAAANQANKAKSTFLNSMSHDIRTPMNAIIGFTALAQTHIQDSKKVQDYLTKISTSGTHLLNLINDVLDMSRIESGTVKLEEKPVHLREILQDVRTMIQGLVHSKNQNLYIDIQNLEHEDAVTDKLRLNQVLLNIVGNAVKYTKPGGDIRVCLAEKPCRRRGYATYEFSVADNGIGMSKEFQEHIFDTFSREYSSTVSGVQGTGLGMAIAKNIVVNMMGGTIEVESEEGKGSRFTVVVDLRLDGEMTGQDPVGKIPGSCRDIKEKAHYDYSGKRVLLVEDNELNREIATALLAETGMEIDSVTDGDEAVTAIEQAPADRYDLILMDVQMPRMDGYTATREIRTLQDNRKANIPIVAMTANAFEEDREMSLKAGMNGHIIKPISMKEIARALDEIFPEKS